MPPRWTRNLNLPLGFGEIFTYQNPTTKEVLHFDIEAMWAASVAGGRISSDVELLDVMIDPTHLAQLRTNASDEYASTIDEEDLELPVLAILFDNDDTMPVDGSHRYLAHAQRGADRVRMIRYKKGTWRKFLVDLPPALSAALAADIAPALHWEAPSLALDAVLTACGYRIAVADYDKNFTRDPARVTCSGCLKAIRKEA